MRQKLFIYLFFKKCQIAHLLESPVTDAEHMKLCTNWLGHVYHYFYKTEPGMQHTTYSIQFFNALQSYVYKSAYVTTCIKIKPNKMVISPIFRFLLKKRAKFHQTVHFPLLVISLLLCIAGKA